MTLYAERGDIVRIVRRDNRGDDRSDGDYIVLRNGPLNHLERCVKLGEDLYFKGYGPHDALYRIVTYAYTIEKVGRASEEQIRHVLERVKASRGTSNQSKSVYSRGDARILITELEQLLKGNPSPDVFVYANDYFFWKAATDLNVNLDNVHVDDLHEQVMTRSHEVCKEYRAANPGSVTDDNPLGMGVYGPDAHLLVDDYQP